MLVCYDNDNAKLRAQIIAEKLKTNIINKVQIGDNDYYLMVQETALSIYKKGILPIKINFANSQLQYRLKYGGGLNQALLKAVGMKSGKKIEVFDATAGFGEDSYVMASFGAKVTMCENYLPLFLLLEDGLLASRDDILCQDVVSNICLIYGNSCEILKEFTPDIVYMDPMFVKPKNKAAANAQMTWLREVLLDEDKSHELLEIALKQSKKRVVVKRAKHAPQIAKPSFILPGKSCRFDVYLVNNNIL